MLHLVTKASKNSLQYMTQGRCSKNKKCITYLLNNTTRYHTLDSRNTYFNSVGHENLPKHWELRYSNWSVLRQSVPVLSHHIGSLKTHNNSPHTGSLKLSLPDVAFIETTSYAANISTSFDLLPPKHPLRKNALVARVNGDLWDMTRPLPPGTDSVELFTFDHPLGVDTAWHSGAHVLGQALEFYYREHTVYLSDGPALEDGGFFYDVLILDKNNEEVFISTTDMDQITLICRSIVSARQPFERIETTISSARKVFGTNPFKHETLNKIALRYSQEHNVSSAEAELQATVSLYRCGPLIDLCRGPHIPSTGSLNGILVHKTSASVLRNPIYYKIHDNTVTIINDNEDFNPQHYSKITHVQRIYGIAFPEKSQLKDWENAKLLAEKSDHRKLGRSQHIFTFHPLSPGSAFFLPHGTRIYNRLKEYIREEYRKRGYSEIKTPLIFDKSLWERSGHWENYKEDMFYVSKGNSSEPAPNSQPSLTIPSDLKPEEVSCVNIPEIGFGDNLSERCSHLNHDHINNDHHHGRNVDPLHEGTQALKPMNCPGHCVLFGLELHSYRDLPLRYADFSTLHRNEISGALTGLTRVRSFTQDDAHIFCTEDQMEQELRNCLSFISDVYSTFKFPLKFKLSTRPENYIGDITTWDRAEKTLQETLTNAKLQWELNPGDGAFYGPKVDVAVKDALGRWHQCATVQLDFNLPQRFGLKFKGMDGADHTPVMIHRAILGSIERFMAVLIEHTTGKLPLWLSPRQVLICPVSPQFESYAQKIYQLCHDAGLYVDIGDAHQSLAKQVKIAQPLQYNYIVIVGANEEASNTVSIRPRGTTGNEKDPLSISDFIHRMKQEVHDKI